jgi:hypothetical protein
MVYGSPQPRKPASEPVFAPYIGGTAGLRQQKTRLLARAGSDLGLCFRLCSNPHNAPQVPEELGP